MGHMERWQARRQQTEAALAGGLIEPDRAARELAHLDYRIRRRPLIQKRGRDRRAWRAAQAQRQAQRYRDRQAAPNAPGAVGGRIPHIIPSPPCGLPAGRGSEQERRPDHE